VVDERERERERERAREGETALKDRWIAAMLNLLASERNPCLPSAVIVARDATTPPASGIATPSESRANQ